jgi:SAM-dependent methyltransferase
MVLQAISRRVEDMGLGLLKIDFVRYYVCYTRWLLHRGRLRVNDQHGDAVSDIAISYNLTAFDHAGAAFGMAKRMSLVLFPLAAIFRSAHKPRVLIVGPRTEDDILWARSLGLTEARGLDLFSYSELIDVGDVHDTKLPSRSQDAVVLGWILAYSKDPAMAIAECKRLLKPGGYLAVGMETIVEEKFATMTDRANRLNTVEELKAMVNEEVVFCHDPKGPGNREVAAIFRVSGAR